MNHIKFPEDMQTGTFHLPESALSHGLVQSYSFLLTTMRSE